MEGSNMRYNLRRNLIVTMTNAPIVRLMNLVWGLCST